MTIRHGPWSSGTKGEEPNNTQEDYTVLVLRCLDFLAGCGGLSKEILSSGDSSVTICHGPWPSGTKGGRNQTIPWRMMKYYDWCVWINVRVSL